MSNSPTTSVPDDDELKESIAQLITGGVFYYELTDSFMNDSVLEPQFPARWPSDVAQEVDKLVEFIKSYGDSRELEGLRRITADSGNIYYEYDDGSRVSINVRTNQLQSQKEKNNG